MPEWNPRSDGWFSGFTDGEGCFYFTTKQRHGFEVCPRFAVCLRKDDSEVLERLRATFGGTIHLEDARRNGAPNARWDVSAKADLTDLVAYFDSFPLRAKKRNDYSHWRKAVLLYAASGSTHPELPALREATREARRYTEAT